MSQCNGDDRAQNLTKRELMAAIILSGLHSGPPVDCPKIAVQTADQLIAELNRLPSPLSKTRVDAE